MSRQKDLILLVKRNSMQKKFSTWIGKSIFIGIALCMLFVGQQAFAADPWPPGNVTVSKTSTSATISWTAPTNTGGSVITGYDVADHVLLSGETPSIVTGALNYTASPLLPNTNYTYSVIAINFAGNYSSPTGAVISFKTDPATGGGGGGGADVTPPTAPTNVHVTANTTGKSVTIAWNPSTDNVGVVGYSVQKCTSCAPVTGSNKTVTSFTIGAGNTWNPYLTPLTAYTYYVTAYDAAGYISGYVTPASAVTFQTPAEAPGTNPGTGTDTGGGYNFNVKFVNPLGPNGPQDIPTLLNKILDALMLFLVPIVVLFIIYAGFLFVMAQGNDLKLTKAKSVLGWTLVGAAILLGAKIITTVLSSTVTNILK